MVHFVVHVERNPPLDASLRRRLVDVWAAVSNAGGAVGFVPPVQAADIRPVAEAAFERVDAGADDLAVAYADSDVGAAGPGADSDPVGFGFLATNEWELARHWASIKRLQRHPDCRGRGIGGALLAELEAAAVDRGLERLALTVRGGTGREGFYLARGFTLDARLPGRIRVGGEPDREELVMSKTLAGDEVREDAGDGVGGSTTALPVRRLDPQLPLPSYAHPGDAGLDLRAREAVSLQPGERAVVPTGIAVAVPPGCVGLVHARSGLAARAGLALVNAPGTIDAGYRGEVKVILVNLDGHEPVHLERGERIAQLLVQRVETMAVTEVAELPAAARGSGGFGSTGR